MSRSCISGLNCHTLPAPETSLRTGLGRAEVTCHAAHAVSRAPGAQGQLGVGATPVHSVAALLVRQVMPTQCHADTDAPVLLLHGKRFKEPFGVWKVNEKLRS